MYGIGNKASINNDSCSNRSIRSISVIPYVEGVTRTIYSDEFFKVDDFTNNFTTNDNSTFETVRIVNLPSEGIILYEGVSITNGFELDLININKLQYILTNIAPTTITFNFQTSNNNKNKYFSNMATFQFNIDAYVNLPPSAVGDNSVTIDNASTYTFTVADFTTNTTPAYSDPEGDSPANLKVTSLMDDGTLQFNNVEVTLNQIIPFEGAVSIESGALQYIASQVNKSSDIESFNFEISDEGSNTFIG